MESNLFGNDVFRAVATAVTEETTPIPDQRTGQPVFSRKNTVPKIDLLNTIDLTNLEKATDPLLLGAISDKNRKFFDSLSLPHHVQAIQFYDGQ